MWLMRDTCTAREQHLHGSRPLQNVLLQNEQPKLNTKKMKRLTALLALSLALGVQAQHTMTVDVAKPTAKIQPTMYGVFFEDINFGADGGLYAELVKNRSFEFP